MILRYSLPRVQGRGAGLGNELIPWARSFLAAQMLGAQSLHPAFGMNTRRYWRHFGTPRYDFVVNRAIEKVLPVVHYTEADYLRYGGGDFVKAFAPFAEEHDLHNRSHYALVTDGMWGGYRHIAAARDFVYCTLYQSRFAAKNLLSIESRLDTEKITVAMHVRLGDFGTAPAELCAYQGKVTIPRQSRGLSICEPLKAAKRGRLRGPNSWCHLFGGGYFHSASWSNFSSSCSWCRM